MLRQINSTAVHVTSAATQFSRRYYWCTFVVCQEIADLVRMASAHIHQSSIIVHTGVQALVKKAMAEVMGCG